MLEANSKASDCATICRVAHRDVCTGRECRPRVSLEFRIAEMIREKLTLELNQEVPYGVAVEVETQTAGRGRPAQSSVDAAIWVDRAGQKPIVIGAKGERLKRG